MELNTKVNGKMTYNMVKVSKHGQTRVDTKENMHLEESMALGLITGMMGRSTHAIGLKTK